MFGPSLKSVPGCFVSIVPMLIGVPVAFTPGFGPHDEVLTDVPLLLAVPALDVAALVVALELAALLVLELLLLPHPARTNRPVTEMAARLRRTRAEWWYIRTVSSP
ncbi:MAG TPA: hypothetical protein VMU39_20520 [Solirubrobacteraceae bacterium]|nr:hypothetical protein [Solirubrobacteraceae bacterium]